MTLSAQVQHMFHELEVKFKAHDPANLLIAIQLADESDCLIVVNIDEDSELVRFTVLDVFNLEQHSDLDQQAPLSLWLMRINSQFKIGAFHSIEDGEVRFEYSMFATSETLQQQHLLNCIRACMNATTIVRRDLAKLRLSYGTKSSGETTVDIRSIIPEAIYDVYQTQLALLSDDNVDVDQLYTAHAVLQGFLSANFSETFNSLIRSDLAKIQQVIERLTPTEF